MNWFDFEIASTGLGFTAALVGGVFLSFSELVMDALGRIDKESGIRGMQRINRRVFRSLFLFSALGLAPVMTWTAVQSYFHLEGTQRLLILSGTATYIIGMLGVTLGGNVPLNEKLAEQLANTAEAADYWQFYLKVWTRWNHIRTAASFIAGGLLVAVPFFG